MRTSVSVTPERPTLLRSGGFDLATSRWFLVERTWIINEAKLLTP